MALPQHLTYQKGGTVYIDIPYLPSAATVRVVDGDGTEQLADTAATLSTIDTTTTGAISAGDTSVNVTAATGMDSGDTFWFKDDPEECLIEAVAGTTVTLRRPTLYAHVSGAEVEGARLSYYVNASTASGANTLWWDGHCEWNIVSTASPEGRTYYTAAECTRYPLDRLCSAQDLFDLEPKLFDIVDSEQDIERLLDVAHEHVLGQISKAAPDQRARVFVGSMAFKTATALAALYIHYRRRAGDDARDLADRYKTDLKEELDALVGVVPRDADQDVEIEIDEKISMHTTRLRRG